MNSPVATTSPSSSILSASMPFAAYVDGRMPRPLRESAETKTFDEFVDEYAPSAGPLRLGQWACTDGERPSGRLGPQARNYQATLALGDTIGTSRAAACGPVAALTEMLHARGVAVEMVAFHQLPAGEHTATFIRGSRDGSDRWAMGWSDDPTDSALRAVIACANRLLAD
ncbi:homocitrate synthase [Mycolicibacterium iranicum]|uniref:Homocitrate synthase n=2 Tax=Mycolicibacterium iranicum TaxID=912594 RepID=A0A1X1WP08_MYCIR|nr:homocitrate synthase [Mycolicibacterium iranicum]